TYGPRMHPNDGRVVSNFVIQALRGQPLTVYGRGEQTRSFCYVSDMVEALVALMHADPTIAGPVNLGNPVEHTVLELAETTIRLTGSRSRTELAPLPPADPARRCPDIGRAERALGWRPVVALEDGLRATIDYFDDVLSRRDDRAAARFGPPLPAD